MTTYIYLIINALISIAIENCSEISFTVGSYRIGWFLYDQDFQRYFRSVHTSKIVLLLNYFIFVNLFQLTLFSDHCPTLRAFAQKGYFIFFRDTRSSQSI